MNNELQAMYRPEMDEAALAERREELRKADEERKAAERQRYDEIAAKHMAWVEEQKRPQREAEEARQAERERAAEAERAAKRAAWEEGAKERFAAAGGSEEDWQAVKEEAWRRHLLDLSDEKRAADAAASRAVVDRLRTSRRG